jgi:hypothetical protein
MDSPSASFDQRNVAKEYRNSVQTNGQSLSFTRPKECAGSIEEFHEKNGQTVSLEKWNVTELCKNFVPSKWTTSQLNSTNGM